LEKKKTQGKETGNMEVEKMAEKMTLEKCNDLRVALSQFTGTEHYFKHWTGKLLFTDGMQYLSNKAGAYWLLDIIASYQGKLKRLYDFQIWSLLRDNNGAGDGCVITMKIDTGEPDIIRQHIKFTDFPFDVFKCYVIDGIAMLPSEY